MVAHRHGVITEHIHALEVGHGILQVRLRHPGVHVATIEQQRITARQEYFRADLVDHGFAGRHAVFAITVLPESTVVVVGVQDRDVVNLVFFGARWRHRRTADQGQRCQGAKNGFGRSHGVALVPVGGLPDYGRWRNRTQ